MCSTLENVAFAKDWLQQSNFRIVTEKLRKWFQNDIRNEPWIDKTCFAGIFENASKPLAENSPKCLKRTSGNDAQSHAKSMKMRTWTARLFQLLTFCSVGVSRYPPPSKNQRTSTKIYEKYCFEMLRNIVNSDTIEILTLVHYSSKFLPNCKVTKWPGQKAMGNLRVGGMRRKPGKFTLRGATLIVW